MDFTEGITASADRRVAILEATVEELKTDRDYWMQRATDLENRLKLINGVSQIERSQ